MDDLDILTLAEAAARLGVAQSTLRNQVKAGRLQARKLGKTWITTGAEVERYRSESLGQPGRPSMAPGFRVLGIKAELKGEPGACATCAPLRGQLFDPNGPHPELPIAGCTSDRGCTCRYE